MSKAVAIPFSEPPWLMGLPSAYYNDSHRQWQKTCRAFIDKVMMPEGGDWEKAGDVPGTDAHLLCLLLLVDANRTQRPYIRRSQMPTF
jgi:hypothetical protein